ncbi:MAG: metal ABC transporter permease [Deltaproteobacteria bacterium]|nr:metal ABC transporter permease [Deltaproteobacteria bacterium]
MSLFWEHFFNHAFLQYAILAGLLASVACGVVGSFVVVRRMTYLAGAIAHCVLGGMGAARYLQRVQGVTWMTPFLGATFAAVVAALIISVVTFKGRQREDTVLSAVWAIGMATGISFITATPGYSEDLMSYLFGNILMVGASDLLHIAMLDAVVVALMFLFYDKFLVISFLPELARLRGVRVDVYHTALLVLTSLTVVILTQVVGLVMVIALLTLPAATAFQFAGRLWSAMIIAAGLCVLFTIGGIALSYGPELPVGATVIQLAGGVYLLVLFGKKVWRRLHQRAITNRSSNAAEQKI